eukprot:m.162627 g.162627  ORF g.162627 m.162627 type:complete len:96 (-) comp17669_c0_seq4:33-320(-)
MEHYVPRQNFVAVLQQVLLTIVQHIHNKLQSHFIKKPIDVQAPKGWDLAHLPVCKERWWRADSYSCAVSAAYNRKRTLVWSGTLSYGSLKTGTHY